MSTLEFESINDATVSSAALSEAVMHCKQVISE